MKLFSTLALIVAEIATTACVRPPNMPETTSAKILGVMVEDGSGGSSTQQSKSTPSSGTTGDKTTGSVAGAGSYPASPTSSGTRATSYPPVDASQKANSTADSSSTTKSTSPSDPVLSETPTTKSSPTQDPAQTSNTLPSTQSGPATASVPKPTETLTYANLAARVFTPYCLPCHGKNGLIKANVNVDGYLKLRPILATHLDVTVNEKSMPPDKPIPDELQALFLKWYEAGAPEK